MNADIVQQYSPHALLKPFVHGYYYIKHDQSSFDRILKLYPSNFSILCFDKNRQHFEEIEKQQHYNYSVCFLGISDQSKSFTRITEEVLQIVFKPFGIYNILGVPQPELANTIQDASPVFEHINVLTSRLEYAACDHLSFIQATDQWLLQQMLLQQQQHTKQIQEACQKIDSSGGTLPVKTVCRLVGMSERSFRHHFTQQVGINPKMYSRITRFNLIHNLMEKATTPMDWQDIIHRFGFFDQTHFINEFKWFYNSTPSALLQNQFDNLNNLITD